MKRFSFWVLLAVFFVSPYAFAQIPSCPCDTLQLSDGTTGNEIVELLCPGGELVEDAFSEVGSNGVVVGIENGTGYIVITPPDDPGICIIANAADSEGTQLSDQEAANCRQRLIQGCNLDTSLPIPTLSEWGLIVMAGLMGVAGLFVAARRRRAAA